MSEVKLESFKPNSHKYNEAKKEKEEQLKEKRTEKVIEGTATIRKQSLFSKFCSSFFGGDAKTASEYVIFEVLFPRVKQTLSEMVSNGIDTLLFGSSRGRGDRNRGGNERVSYASYYKSDARDNRRDDAAYHYSRDDYRNIVVETRGEAEEIIDALEGIIDEYGQASVADLYDAAGVTGNFTDNKYGWLSMKGIGIRLTRTGYLIEVPKAVPLD